MPCIEYKGKKYTYEEFGAMLRDGAFAKMAKSRELNVENLGAEVPSSLLEAARKQIAPQTSSNFANLTTDKDGNYVFFHRGAKGFDEIRPGTGQSGITPSNEAAAIGRVGGVAMYYTKPTDSETMVSGQAQYAVTIAPDEVYDFNEDPENYIVEARQRFEQEHPGKAFDANNQLAYITKIAGENGYKMVVAEWTNGRTRAQTTEALKPTDTQLFEGDVVTKTFDKEYTTNEQKGWSPVVPETKQKKLDALYNKIYRERNKQNRYDDLYHLEADATKKTQDEITELINNSDISQELKDEYNQILGEKEQTRRSERKSAQDLVTEVERIKSVDKADEDGATFNLDGTKYDGVGLVVPAASINTTVEELTPEMITDFVDQQRSKIGDDAVVKVGIYKFKDSNKVSIDLNIIAPESSRDVAIEFARLAGQESLFDLRTFENIKTGADGKNPINFSDKQFKEIAKALKEGKMPNVFGAQETTALDDIFDNTEIQSEVDNALKAMSEIMPELNIVVHDTYESYLDALGESEEAESGGFFDGENTIHINKRAASDTTVAHEVFHAVLKKMLGSERAIQKKALSMVRNLSGQIKSDPQLKAALDEFVGRYTENPETMNEEAVSELFGMLNAGYAELKPVERSAIRKFIDAIAKLLGLGDFLRVKENEYVDLLNTLSQRIKTGEAITAEDVVSLSEQGGKPVVGTFTKKKSLGVKAPSVKDDTRDYVRELIKEINLSLLEGQKFLTNMYDFTSAGDIDLGNGIIIIGFGGKNYVPYIMSLKGKKLNDISNIAAFNSEQNAKDFIRAAQEGNVSLFAPHSGGLESSWQFQQHIFAELIDAILDNDIMSSKELIDRFNTFSTSKEGTKAFRTFSKRYAKEFGNEIKDLSVFEKNPRELVRLLDIDNNFSPDLRKFLQSRIITTNKFKERLGYSNSIQFAERLMDPLNKGVKGGEIMSVIEFDPTTLKIEKTKIDDIDHHPSFGWTVVGKVKNIYQPTEFHQSKDITDSYTFYNTEGVRVSKPSDYLAIEYVKEYELAKKGLAKDKKTGNTKKRTGGVFEGTLEDYAEFLFNQSNVSSSSGSIVKVAQFRPSRKKQIVGQNAKLSQDVRDNLEVARQMESSGKSEKEIRTATGWERGADDKWRYEIDYLKFKEIISGRWGLETSLKDIIENALKGGLEQYDLNKVISNDELFDLYPKLKKVSLAITNSYKSGFEQLLPKNVEAAVFNDYGVKTIAVKPNKNIDVLESTIAHEIQHIIQEEEGFAVGADMNYIGVENYIKSSGEVESRNVEKRMKMTPEQRRETLLSETEDVSREDQVVFFQNPTIIKKQTPSISKKIEAALNSGATEQEIIDKMTQVGYTEAEAKAYIEQYNNMRSDEYSRVKANIGTITKKVSDRAGKNANPKEVRQRQYDDAMNYLQSSLWYENASDTEREMSVRELRSELGFKERTAPVASKVTESKRDTITIDSLQALAQSIRDQNRGAKAALKDLAEKREALRVALKSLVTSGKITNRQASIMLNKAMSVNLNNDNAVDKLIKYIEKVYNNAEIAEKMSKANAMRRVAKKNIRSKIGSAKVAFPILDKLFSIDSREIPLEVLDTYVGIVNQFGKRVGVLSTEKMADVIQKAQDVISAINEEVSKANDLAMIFEMYPDKVLDANGDVLFDKTVKKMKDDGYIDEATAKEMDEYRSDIYKKERATKEEDAQERKDLIKEIVAAKLVTSSRLSDANERKAAREIIQMARNKKILKALSTQSLRNLAAIMKNIDAGFFPNYGVKLMQAMQIEQQLPDVKNTLENVSLRVISNAYNKLKSLVFRGQTSIELTLESNLATELDFMLGDNKNRHVYNSVIKPLAKAYATFDSEVTSIREKMSEAVEMLERQFSGNTNKVAASKFKIMAYMLQKEFETNAGQKGVAPAIDFINQTIKAIKGRDTMYTENDIAILEDIKDNYMTDGQIDMNKIMDSLSAREKKALGILESINASMHDKAIFTSGVIRGNRTNMYNNYVPHSVISKRMDNDEKMASVVNAYNNVQAVGTKAGSLQERTSGAKPIMFDPFLASMNSATDVLLDFHMTIPMQTTSKLLQRTKDELLNDDASDKSIDAVNAVQAIRDRVARFVFTNNKYHDDSILATLGRSYLNTMYRNTLGSVPRFLNELQSNSWYVLTNPANWASGVKYVYKDSDAIGGVQGREIMSLLGSTVVGKLYGKGATGKFADVGLLGSDDVAQDSSSKGSLEVTKDVIARYSVKPLAKFTDYVGDTLVSTPDRLMSIPVWYGSFANEFNRRTGEDIEFSKITDERYRNKYKAALDAATDYADNEVVQAASTVNPFQKAAKLNVDKSKPTYRRFIATVNNYLTNFMITEFNTARAAAYSLVTEGRIPKPKAAAMLTGVYLRVVTYTLMANIITGGFYSLLGFDKDDEEEEELTWDDVVRAAAGGFISMLISRNFGNMFKIVENYGIEQLNEEYGDMLRQGEEYDPYKHSLVFNKIKEKEITKDPLKTLSVNFAGPYGETVKGVWKINDLIEYENRASGKNKFSEMKKRMSLSGRRKAERMEEMKNDVIFRVGAGSGLIPFAKDIKPIMSGRYKKKGED
jgi:hypothetical protein